jgi:oligoribonuclease NrnB/cAMP/cGMP phosphodiesterase (DHH superfamily)
MRLVTRGDLDGLTCALLITECERIDGIELVHPQEMTDRKHPINANDILANLPYHPACGKWFDNHLLTDAGLMPRKGFVGKYGSAPSAARMVYEYYRPQNARLERRAAFVAEVDRFDSGQLTREDVTDPKGVVLLGYTLDPRTGLGAFKDYFSLVLAALRTKDVEEVLALAEPKARVKRMREQDRAFREATLAHSARHDNVLVTDFRAMAEIPVGNRFLVYTLFPEANVSLRVAWGPKREKVVVNLGWSIFKRTCKTNVGVLMSLYGGGGHKGAGSCMLPVETADAQVRQMIDTLRANG